MSGDHTVAKAESAAKLSRANAKLDRCRDRGNVRLSDLEAVRNDLAELVDEHSAALAELERLRAEVADFPELLANAQEVGLERIEAAFGEGWDKCRKHLDDEAQIKRQIYVTEYSNTLPWPKWAAPQQPERDGAGS